MYRFMSVAAILIILFAGCATYPDVDKQRLLALPQHYVQFDAHLAWEIRDAGTHTIIDGEFRNTRYRYMSDVEVWVAALGNSGKTVARSSYFIIPRKLERGATAPFTLKLPIPPVPGTKLRFTYKYEAIEGAGTQGGDIGRWRQTFDTEIPR